MSDATTSAVAIVGIGCRYPGANGPEQLWGLLCDAVDAVVTVPEERPALTGLRHSASPGRFGGFIHGVEDFDAAFFGISPREAAKMDPQKRVLLETVWEAFEDAGIPPASLAGSNTGVFVGEQATDYWDLVRSEDCDLHTLVGSQQRAALPGRISYFFDFRGPSLSVEAACAASLVSVHLAAEAVRSGRSQVCVAAGTNVILLPDQAAAYGGAGALSDDGHCKFGDARADGFTRSEGVAALVLKNLDLARADGDRVYAVIRGGAVGHDGNSSGNPMRPSTLGQASVLRAAYRHAGIDPARVDYVEAHGTGTPVGDFAELSGLGQVIGSAPGRTDPLLVGSLKTNIGHTEAAAGIGGVIKAALCLHEGQIPASLHLLEPNPRIAWEELRLRIPTTAVALPTERPGVAGVSAFGISGVNAHLVLTGPDEPNVQRTPTAARPAHLLPLSAHSPEALLDLAARYAAFLDADGAGRSLPLDQLCANAAIRRGHHAWRLAVIGSDHSELVAVLRECKDIESLSPVSPVPAGARRRLAFVFSGHGSQWAGMARELLAVSTVFADALEACDQAVLRECGWSVKELLLGDTSSDYHDVDRVHPSLFAVHTALHALLVSWGLAPDTVLGHSLGEVSAALAAGALSLDDAARIICRRSELLARLVGRGAMAWVGLSEAEAASEIADFGDDLVVAVVNDTASVVLSGEPEALESVCSRLTDRGVFCKRIAIDVAAHSPQLDAFAREMDGALHGIEHRRPAVSMFSSVLGAKLEDGHLDESYWVRNLRDMVRFGPAVRALLDDEEGGTSLVEIAPHPVVLPSLQGACGAEDVALACQRRGTPQYAALLEAVGQLWEAGHEIDWEAVFGGRPQPVRLPGYPWQRERYALPAAPRQSADDRAMPLLRGLRRSTEADATHWEGVLDLSAHSYLLDHRVEGIPVLAGAAYVGLLAEAVAQTRGEGPLALTDVVFTRPLLLDPSRAPRLRLALEAADGSGRYGFTVCSQDAQGRWAVHASGNVRPASAPGERTSVYRPDPRIGGSPAEFYAYWASRGNEWGGAFRALQHLHAQDGEASGTIRQETPSTRTPHCPATLLDACFHVAVAALAAAPGSDGPASGGAVVAAGIDRIELYAALPDTVGCRANITSRDGRSAGADMEVIDETGRLLLAVTGLNLALRPAATSAGTTTPLGTGPGAKTAPSLREDLYEVVWEPTRPAVDPYKGRVMVLTDRAGVGSRVAELTDHVLVTPGTEYRRLGPRSWQVAPGSTPHFAKLLAEAGPCTHIFHLWGLDADDLEASEGAALTSTTALARALAERLEDSPSITFVTRGAQAAAGVVSRPEQALLWGLTRTLRNELPDLRLRNVDLDPAGTDPRAEAAALLRGATEETETAFRDGVHLSPRLRQYATQPSLSAAPVPYSPAMPPTPPLARASRPGPGRVTVRTAYTGVNFADVLVSCGAFADRDDVEPVTGWECSGVVTALGPGVRGLRVGDEVVALTRNAFADEVDVSAELAYRLPVGLDLAQAATYPTAYVTAYLALVEAAALRPGETVLIHAAAGGVGLAALRIAQWRGARVFATAGTAHKRALLRYLGAEYVGDSRSTDFAREVLALAGGMDVILNTTLSGSGWQANGSLLAPYGRLVDLTKSDPLAGHRLVLTLSGHNATYALLDVARMQDDQPERLADALREVMRLGAEGVLPPLPHQVFTADQHDAALALMARGGHVGKILVERTPGAAPKAPRAEPTQPAPQEVDPVIGRRIRPDGTYLITGGLGALGLSVAQWLVQAGARHLLLTGRSPEPRAFGPEEGSEVLRTLRARAEIEYVQANAADPAALREALDARSLRGVPAVRGVVHTAGALTGCEVTALTPELYATALRPKAYGARVLTEVIDLSRTDFVWFFSAGSALLGLPFLGAYASANAYLDSLAHDLRRRGVAATSINWGYWARIGMAARRERELGRDLVPAGMRAFAPEEGLEVLAGLLRDAPPQVAVLPTDWARWQRENAGAAAASLFHGLVPAEMPDEVPRPSDDGLRTPEAPPAPPAPDRPMADEDGAASEEASSGSGHADLLAFVREQAGHILGVRPDRVHIQRALNTQGLDSLLAMELRVRIENEHGVTVPTARLFTLTPQELADWLAQAPVSPAAAGTP
ncbi:acyltransferase domain-containing protein [Streptomyces sp. NPDC002952]|uniref:acyltransferase domain-containing protein n=1 Tax=Streptomyces sp. NPDC002952 TaxID=3364673 RepID=UPI0036D11E5E